MVAGTKIEATWYQPLENTAYTDIVRFEKDESITAYCLTPGATTLKATTTSVNLAGATALLASSAFAIISLATF